MALVFPVAVVGDVEDFVFFHRLDDRVEVLLSGGDIFQYDTVFDTLAAGDRVADAEGVVEP